MPKIGKVICGVKLSRSRRVNVNNTSERQFLGEIALPIESLVLKPTHSTFYSHHVRLKHWRNCRLCDHLHRAFRLSSNNRHGRWPSPRQRPNELHP